MTLTVPPGVRPGLLAAGVAEGRLVEHGKLVVHSGPTPTDSGLAHFGSGADTLTVDAADPGESARAVVARGPQRAAQGVQLAANPRVDASAQTRALLRSGLLDPRAMAVLAVLSTEQTVTVLDLPAVPGDAATQPRRQVALAALDGSAAAWLRGQRQPFRPDVAAEPGRTVLSWPLVVAAG